MMDAQSKGKALGRLRRIEGQVQGIQRMLDSNEPYVLDIIVPYTEHVLPFIPAGRTVADMIWKA